jgi:GT2 family glycosyltransferase
MDLSIIIVSFNTERLLKGCLESLCRAVRPLGKTVLPASLNQGIGDKPSWTWGGRRIISERERLEKEYQKKPSAEVIVIDNASTDGSCDLVRQEFPWVKLVCLHQNLGFAKACNLGIKESSGRYLLLLNPDTIVYPRTLEVMSRYLDKYPRVAVSTCRVELPNGEFDLPAHRGFPTPWRAFCHFVGLGRLFPRSRLFNSYHLGHLDFKRIHEIDSPMGAFYLVRREAVDQVGLLDEDFFWYGEDLDWSYRFKQAGWKITYVPHVKILHYHGAASGVKKSSQFLSSADQQTKRMAVRESVKAMKLFYQKHYREKYPRFITWLVLLGIRLLESYRVRRWGK